MSDYRGGGRGYGRSGGQAANQGMKRAREEALPAATLDPRRKLVDMLMAVGDRPGATAGTLEQQLDELVRMVRRDIKHINSEAHDVIMECAIELPTKTPYFAALLGKPPCLLNVEDKDFVGKVLARCFEELNACLASGDKDRNRLLLRFIAALSTCNVLRPVAVAGLLRDVVAAAVAAAADAADRSDLTWQPWADYMVYCALAALPWAGSHLAQAAPEELEQLLASAEQYMSQRLQRASGAAFRPFAGPTGDGEDAAAASDSGGASFLGQLWQAVQECKTEHEWQVASVPRVSLDQMQSKLPGSNSLFSSVLVAQPHELPAVAVPSAPPAALAAPGQPAAAAAAALAARYPPRGGIRLLDRTMTEGAGAGSTPRPAIERFVAEEYILDTIRFFEVNRVECAKQLAAGLPLPYDYQPLLAETLFAQMLRLPAPELKPLTYYALMVDMCKLSRAFARPMSSCVRELFGRMAVLDPALRGRLAAWLAFHLSHFSFVWPWAKWAHVVPKPPGDAQRLFCQQVLHRLVRLSYWEKVKKVLEDGGADSATFLQLLGPKPEARLQALPGGAGGNGAAPMEAEGSGPVDAEGVGAAKVLEFIRDKRPGQDMLLWVDATKQEAALGGVERVVRMVARGALAIGVKSLSHMHKAFQRVAVVLQALLQRSKEGGAANGEAALLSYVAEVFAELPETLQVALAQLLEMRLVSCEGVIDWALASTWLDTPADFPRFTAAWSALYTAAGEAVRREASAAEVLINKRAATALAKKRAARAVAAADAATKVAQNAINTPRQAYALQACEEATKFEEACSSQVKNLEAEVAAAEAAMPAAKAELDRVLLHAYRGLAGWLVQPGAGEGEGQLAPEARAAQLQSFARHFYLQSAAVAEQLMSEELPAAAQQALAPVLPGAVSAAGADDDGVQAMAGDDAAGEDDVLSE